MKLFERYQSWLHIVGWTIFISLPFLTLPDFVWNKQDLTSIGTAQLLTCALIIACFYVNLRTLTPNLLRDQNSRRFFAILFAMLVGVIVVKVACYYLVPPSFVLRQPQELPPPSGGQLRLIRGPGGPRSPWPGALGSGLSFGVAMLVSSLMALFRYHTRSQEQQQQMTLEKVSAELAMLKLQVSPHFLFNTLNNIRWLARQKSDQTEAAVVTLAQLLRYMIYQAQQDRVPLRQEVGHLTDYINLQKMRLTAQHTVRFDCEGDIDAYQIEPLLFVPFVENAFKYGIHGQQPGNIYIYLRVTDDTLTFGTENSTSNGTPTDATQSDATRSGLDKPANRAANADSGIGVANVQKRLALHYPGRHELLLSEHNHQFRVKLTLHLHHDEVALHRH